MTGNVNVTEGSGKTVATDEVDGIQYQKIKLMGGDPNSASPIMGDSTYGMDVDVTRLPDGSMISTLNSFSGSDVAYGEFFTGEFEDASSYGEIAVSVYDGTGGDYTDVYVEYSSDGVNVDSTIHVILTNGQTDSIAAKTFPVLAKYFRVRCVSN